MLLLTAMSTPEMRLGSPISMALERVRSIIIRSWKYIMAIGNIDGPSTIAGLDYM